jgi:hypothetical protein
MQQPAINHSLLPTIVDLFSKGCAYIRTDWNPAGKLSYSTYEIFTYAAVPDGSRKFRLKWSESTTPEIDPIFFIHPLSVRGREDFTYIPDDREEGNIMVYRNRVRATPYIEDPDKLLVKNWVEDLRRAKFDGPRTLFYAIKECYPAHSEIKFGRYLPREGSYEFSEVNFIHGERL